MPRVDYAPEADDDLVGIADSIARDKPEAARNWIRKILETCEIIATQPDIGELGERQMRIYLPQAIIIFSAEPSKRLEALGWRL